MSDSVTMCVHLLECGYLAMGTSQPSQSTDLVFLCVLIQCVAYFFMRL